MSTTSRSPIVVMPPVYLLPGTSYLWRWCKLNEICEIVPKIALTVGFSFTPTPEDLVWRFAALTPYNREQDGNVAKLLTSAYKKSAGPKKDLVTPKKIFRYSKDGNGFWGTEVPTNRDSNPPYAPFFLDIGVPYPKELLVREDWVAATLRAVLLGAIAAVDFAEAKIKLGFPAISDKSLIFLEGKPEPLLVKVPEGIRS